MSASDIFEIVSSILFLVIGVCSIAYAYGLTGERLLRRSQWNPEFKKKLRWIGPLLVVLCIVSLILILR